jgi:hypothetical protein
MGRQSVQTYHKRYRHCSKLIYHNYYSENIVTSVCFQTRDLVPFIELIT